MPRQPRIKPAEEGAYYHVTNRISGMPGEYPFGDAEKDKFISLIKHLSGYFTIEVIAYTAMGNHYHLVCYAPGEAPPSQAAAERYNRFYEGRKPPISPEEPYCQEVAARMRDISCFTARLQQQFTSWFNRTRPGRRRGALWQSRFKSVLLERETALFNCLVYVELNACRANLVSDPADYRFGSWGEWCASGRHPFALNLEKHLVEFEGGHSEATTLDAIKQRFRVEFARTLTSDADASTDEIEIAMAKAAKEPPAFTRFNRRVRYWSDGLIIGGKRFIRETAAAVFDADRIARHRLQPLGTKSEGPAVFAWRQLRQSSA